jgi:hypothetical protein
MSREAVPNGVFITHNAHEKVKTIRGRKRALKKLGLKFVTDETGRWLMHGQRSACMTAASLYAFAFYHDVGDACDCRFCDRASDKEEGLWWMTMDWTKVRRVGSPDLSWYCETPEQGI